MSDYTSIAPPQSNINQSQAFAAALQRAKQIAAKIQPGTCQQQQPSQVLPPHTNSLSGAYKRPLNDDDSGPDAKKFSSPDSYNSLSQSGNMSQAVAQAAAVAARIAATAGTTCEEQIRIPDAIVSHIFGRGSNDTLSHIQAESCCKVQLAQDGEHVVTLRGSRETVTKGRDMIQQMSNENGGCAVDVIVSITMPPPGPNGYPPYQEIMVAGSKVGLVIGKGGETIKMLQQKTGAKMVIIQDGPNQEVIKPLRISGDPQKIEHAKQLVLELIADKDGQRAGGLNSNGNNFSSTGGEQAEVFVPKTAVGVVIGKGGDMIRKIQGETGCKLQFIQGKNDEPGDRRCIIQGTQQQVEDAQRMIEGLIESVMQRINTQTNRNSANAGQNDSANSNYGYGYGVNHTQHPSREEVTFSVPASKCGIVIGRGGETIKLINQQTGAYCEMDRSAVNPPSEKLFKAKGTPEQIEHARQMISEKINMDLVVTSRKPIGNLPNNSQQNSYNTNMQNDASAAAAAYQQQWGYSQQGGWGDQQQQMSQPINQPTGAAGSGQADYSAQWIEYYKSMGMHREAEMIEQQLKVKHQTNTATSALQQCQAISGAQQIAGMTQTVPATTTSQPQTQDFSAQWAEYYRSIGKVEEAEAIEKQMKAANGQTNSTVSGTIISCGNSSVPVPPQQGYPQGMTPSQYAQYSQYYAAAAVAGQAASGYPQQAYPGYGNNYSGTQSTIQIQGSQPNSQQSQKPLKADK